jgi:hypothetical protein
MAPTDPIRVAIVAYEGVSLLDLSGPLEALHIASMHPNHLGAARMLPFAHALCAGTLYDPGCLACSSALARSAPSHRS